MDFDKDDIIQKPQFDHSPTNQSDMPLSKSNASSADGFEHIDGKMDLDFDLVGSGNSGIGIGGVGGGNNTKQQLPPFHLSTDNDMMNDFMTNTRGGGGGGGGQFDRTGDGIAAAANEKFDNDFAPFAPSLKDQAKATVDFMQSERYVNEPPKKSSFSIKPEIIPELPPKQQQQQPQPSSTIPVDFDDVKHNNPSTQSLMDDIEDDYLNPYATSAPVGPKKTNEKFISSEDLLSGVVGIDDGGIDSDINHHFGANDDFDFEKPIDPVELTRDIGFINDFPTSSADKKPIMSEDILKPSAFILPKDDQTFKKPSMAPPSPPPRTTTTTTAAAAAATSINPSHIEDIIDDKQKKQQSKNTTGPAVPTPTPVAAVPAITKEPRISAEEMFCKIGLDAWFTPDRLHPIVESLIYWRDVKKSGIAFGTGFLFLLALTFFSVLSVIAYTSLLIVSGTLIFRLYKLILAAVQKTSDGHPFKQYLEMDISLPQEKVQDFTVVATAHINAFVQELRKIFLVEDIVDTLRFGVLLYGITYIGSWFNGMTLFIMAFVALFTLPKVYENNKQSIDTYLNLVKSKYVEITEKVRGAVPIGKKPETDKEK